jgi:hypothetical protein
MITDASAETEVPTTEPWQKKVQKVERLLDLGRKKAIRDVGKVLDIEENHLQMKDGGENGDGEEAENVDAHAVEGFTNLNLNFELSRTLNYAKRGVKRMVKPIPHDDML